MITKQANKVVTIAELLVIKAVLTLDLAKVQKCPGLL